MQEKKKSGEKRSGREIRSKKIEKKIGGKRKRRRRKKLLKFIYNY